VRAAVKEGFGMNSTHLVILISNEVYRGGYSARAQTESLVMSIIFVLFIRKKPHFRATVLYNNSKTYDNALFRRHPFIVKVHGIKSLQSSLSQFAEDFA
jgi:hypothetical protein